MTDVLSRPRVDPRIAGRWIETRRQEGRRRLRRVIAVGALIGLAGAAGGSLYSPIFELRHVRVVGAGTYSAADIAAIGGVRLHEPLIDLDSATIVSKLDATPTLGGASVRVSWPGTLRVALSIRSPLAVVEVGVPKGGARLAEVDRSGRLLGYVTPSDSSLPEVTGFAAKAEIGAWLPGSPGAAGGAKGPVTGAPVDLQAPSATAPDAISAALGFLQAMPAARRDIVRSLDVAGGKISAQVLSGVTSQPNGATNKPTAAGGQTQVSGPSAAAGTGGQVIRVNLGDGSDLAAKVVALLTIVDQGPVSSVTSIDLSVPGRPVLGGPGIASTNSTPPS